MDPPRAHVQRIREFMREEYQLAFRHERWRIGIVDAPIQSFLESDAEPEIRWIPLPDPGKYWADPFGLPRGPTTEFLFEEFDFRTNRGVISSARVEPDGRVSHRRVAIDLPFHASYPFLIERSGSVYCIPETAQGHEIGLYRAVDFPLRWTKVATLVGRVAALDSTVFERDGRVWLFHTDANDGPFSKLHVWHAPDLFGPWEPHAANPVKADIGSARPAGTPFECDGELYRPGQDSSKTYGGSVVLNRVVRLTETEYREERAAVVGPFQDGSGRDGIHTLSSAGDRTLVDGKRFSLNRTALAWNFREAISGRWGRVIGRQLHRRMRTLPISSAPRGGVPP